MVCNARLPVIADRSRESQETRRRWVRTSGFTATGYARPTPDYRSVADVWERQIVNLIAHERPLDESLKAHVLMCEGAVQRVTSNLLHTVYIRNFNAVQRFRIDDVRPDLKRFRNKNLVDTRQSHR
jgi:hypothetical protein